MKSSFSIITCIAVVYVAFLIAAPRPSIVSAEPRAQATIAATEEPTKRPYAFPTAVFIPTYADDTPVPRSTPGTTIAPLQPGVDTYTVQLGDSPWVIAQKVYGDGTKYKLIMDANGMTDQTKLRVGAVLKIPSVPGAIPSTGAPTLAPNLAPTQIPPTASSLAAPTITPLPTVTPTATPPSPSSTIIGDSLGAIINIFSGILLVASIGCAILAYLRYERIRRLEQLSSGKQPLRMRQ